MKQLNQEDKEWLTKIRLARYKSLSISPKPLEYEEKVIFERLKQFLLEDGITEETIDQAVLEYENLSEDERKQQLLEKVEVLVSQIITYFDENKEDKEIDSKRYPILYYRINELIGLNPTLANQLIKEAFAREKINNCMNCSNSLYGGECTYYFSKKLTYK